jgi:hypothetical protein
MLTLPCVPVVRELRRSTAVIFRGAEQKIVEIGLYYGKDVRCDGEGNICGHFST